MEGLTRSSSDIIRQNQAQSELCQLFSVPFALRNDSEDFLSAFFRISCEFEEARFHAEDFSQTQNNLPGAFG
jgi:hypothetical protein